MNIWERWKRTSLSNKALIILTALLATFGYWQIRITRESSHKELRAYLAMVDVEDSIDIWNKDEKGRHLTFERFNTVRWTIKNLGKTPAYDVRDTSYLVIKDSVTENPRFLPIENSPSTTIGSGLSFPCWVTKSIVEIDKRPRIFLGGKIIYRDVFDETHTIAFLFEYIYAANGWSTRHRFNREYDD